MTTSTAPLPTIPNVTYGDLLRLFLKLSLTAFGGPVAHIAIAEDEIVVRRKWMTRDHYLDLVAATNLIPGPNSTEVMIHVGYVTKGIPGALVAGACFIGPAFLLTLALAILYTGTGQIPQIEAILWGIKPVIVAIIAQAGYRLAIAALRNRALWVLLIVSLAVVMFTPVPEVIVMLAAGVIYGLYVAGLGGTFAMFAAFIPNAADSIYRVPTIKPVVLEAVLAASPSLWDIFFYFLKIGSVLFGSGYVLISYIQQDVVNGFGWLTGRQLLDAVAIGQLTPGPVSTTVAVVGYIVAGLPGALAAALGIFLPSFVLVILTAPLIPKMRQSKFLGGFLSGVNAGVIAAILVTLIDLTGAALKTLDGGAWSPLAILLALVAVAMLIRFKTNATWLILMGGIVGLAASVLKIA
ncbi:MAG: chromate efflux transporter [Anaerolineaceae bacterium]|nr:chromate efflux transporter [Anaerolineaceae bacterium]